MTIKGKYIAACSYLYIVLPPFLFLAGWSKTLWAVIFGMVVVLSLWRCLSKGNDDCPDLPVDRVFIAVVAVLIVMVFLSGIGGTAYQNGDIPYRNRMFSVLVMEEWPVEKSVTIGEEVQTRGFIYYLGFWLVPAVVGKLFGLSVGFLALALWAGLGGLLTWYHIGRYLKRFQVRSLLVFFLFGGLDIVGNALMGRIAVFSTSHIEWWCSFQYSSFTTQLFWVYNQAIYGWILTLMILQCKKPQNLIFIWSTGLLCCTLPFVGMLPYVVYKLVIYLKDSGEKVSDKLKTLFSFENVFGGGVIGLVSFAYLVGNVSAQRLQESDGAGISAQDVREYLLFIILEAFVYLFLLWKKQKGALFYITAFLLALCPLIRVGSSQDFCMRASIPALIVLYLMVLEFLSGKSLSTRWDIRKYVMIALLCLGAASSMHEILRSVENTPAFWIENGFFSPRYISEENIFVEDNFSGNIEDNLYFRCLAKKN